MFYNTALEGKADYKEVRYSKESKKASALSREKTGQAWARLIQKIYKADPFICHRYGSKIKIVTVIQDKSAI